jgi:peroxin-10
VSSLREQTDNILRSWFGEAHPHTPFPSLTYNRYSLRAGTRWLTRFDKEVELFVRLVYEALTTGRGRSPFTFTVDPTFDH